MTTLWAHQAAGVEKLAPMGRGLLAMDVGTGKSLAALDLIRQWDCRFVLIVCPLSMVPVWPKEFRKHGFADWRVLPLERGTCAKRAQALRTAEACSAADNLPFAAVLNYEATIQGAMRDALLATPWDCIVLDESQKIKGPSAKASLLLAQVAAQVPHVIGATGTPLHDTPLDIFAQFRAIAPEVFGTHYWTFFSRYARTILDDLRDDLLHHGEKQLEALADVSPPLTPSRRKDLLAKHGEAIIRRIESGQWPPAADERASTIRELGERYIAWRVKKAPFIRHAVARYQNLDELRERMAPYTYYCRKRDVLDLPPFVHEERHCTLGPKARAAYKAMLKDLRAKVGAGEIKAANVIARTTRLRQIVNGFGVDDLGETVVLGKEKLDLLIGVFEELPAEEQVLVFGDFHHDLDAIRLAAQAAGRTCAEMSGRRRELELWQAGEANVLAAQYRTGGAGVDCSNACYTVYYSHPWSLGDYEQTLGRMDRPGQTRSMTYIHLVASETVDERVMEALADKRGVAEAVMGELHPRGERT